MERFSYHLTGSALRSSVLMLLVLLGADLVGIAGLALFLPRPWDWASAALGAALIAVGWSYATQVLRTRHELNASSLLLRFGRFRLQIERDLIARVEPLGSGVPRGTPVPTRPPHYSPETDTLYLLADRKGLVEVVLREPVAGKTRQQGAFTCTRLVLSLDEPGRFVAALGGRVEPVPSGPAAGQQTPGDPAAEIAVPDRSAAAVPSALPAHSDPMAPAPPAIRLEGLSHSYGGFHAVRSVSLNVAPGEVLAFLGSNGAGKTTTIRMMVGLLRPTGGRVLIHGRDLWAGGPEVRRAIGYVPDVPVLYEGLTAQEFLWLIGGLYSIPRREARHRAEELLTLLRMERWSDHLIRGFSLGMKRKMAIAGALMHRPSVLLLDEATNGLDPRAQREVKDFVLAQARAGTAIFLTTHLLELAGELADRIAIIESGALCAMGTLTDLRRAAGLPSASLEELFLALTEQAGPPGERRVAP